MLQALYSTSERSFPDLWMFLVNQQNSTRLRVMNVDASTTSEIWIAGLFDYGAIP
jgi:hypothetical protein